MAQDSSDRNWEAIEPSLPELEAEFERCIERGRRMHAQLKDWADTTKVYPSIENLYCLESGNEKRVPRDIEDELVRWDVRGQFTWVDVTSPGKGQHTIYSNKGDAWHGAIVHTENKKDRDSNAEEDRIFCSEVVWQTYLVSCSKFKIMPGLLRVLVQHFIINEETKMVIWHAARTADKHRVTQKPSDDKGYRVYEEPQRGFYALLGSTLGAQMLRMLIDHKGEIGFRFVEKVVVFATGKEIHTTQWENARSFMIVLSFPYAARVSKE